MKADPPEVRFQRLDAELTRLRAENVEQEGIIERLRDQSIGRGRSLSLAVEALEEIKSGQQPTHLLSNPTHYPPLHWSAYRAREALERIKDA